MGRNQMPASSMDVLLVNQVANPWADLMVSWPGHLTWVFLLSVWSLLNIFLRLVPDASLDAPKMRSPMGPMATVARMPMMVMTTRSSMRVKPFFLSLLSFIFTNFRF